jgi:hypothetical protein
MLLRQPVEPCAEEGLQRDLGAGFNRRLSKPVRASPPSFRRERDGRRQMRLTTAADQMAVSSVDAIRHRGTCPLTPSAVASARPRR